MTIQQLIYAVEAYRCGSISRAAQNLFMAQPNLSAAIRELESELGARILVQLRHASAAPVRKELRFRAWELDLEEMTLTAAGQPVNLTAHEFKIVELLAGRPKRVFTKQQIYEAVWQEEYAVEDKTITVHISNIRAKLRPSGTDGYIQTVWGIGFKLAEA